MRVHCMGASAKYLRTNNPAIAAAKKTFHSEFQLNCFVFYAAIIADNIEK
jgi:hypothetical protein